MGTEKNNPFRYGIAVDDPYFIDREQELKDIPKWLKNGQSLVIYSPRRYGKTSLMLKILNKLKDEGFKTIYIDFFKVTSRRRFTELYFNEIIKQLTSWEKALHKISLLTKRIRPVVTLDNQGLPNISVRYEDGSDDVDMTEVFDLPQKLAEKKQWIVVFDEFQDVEKLNGASFEKELRSALIHHTKVSYVFMGSKMHMLLNMFTHKNRAFYQFGKLLELKKIPKNQLIDFMEAGFNNSGIKYIVGVAGNIANICNDIPHYVQYLAAGAWEEALENNLILDQSALGRAVDKIITNQTDYFMQQLEELTTHQQRVLLAVSVENKNLFTASFAERFHLSPVSSVQRSLQKLLKKGILTKHERTYFFTDPFFKLWIERELS